MKFGAKLRQIMAEHFGGLIGDQLLVKAMMKHKVDSFESLSEQQRKDFVINLIDDCYDHMVDETRKKELIEEYLAGIEGKKIEKKEFSKREEPIEKIITFTPKVERDFDIVDNISADDMSRINVKRKEDEDKANLVSLLKKVKPKEEEFELDVLTKSIEIKELEEDKFNKVVIEKHNSKILPALMIIISLTLVLLRDFNDVESKLMLYFAIALFVIGALWFIKDGFIK